MDFKRLSDVEKLDKAPEGASALAEVDGKIVRVPFGDSNANLEDLMFDLEYTGGNNNATLTDAEKMQKVIDCDMTVRAVVFYDASGSRVAKVIEFPFNEDTLVHTGASNGFVYCTVKSASDNAYLQVYAERDAYEADGQVVVSENGAYIGVPGGYTVARVYASIF
jgi:hypothetical protein